MRVAQLFEVGGCPVGENLLITVMAPVGVRASFDLDGVVCQIEDCRSVFVDSKRRDIVGEQLLQRDEPRLSEVAEPRVVVATFIVVKMRNDDAAKSEMLEYVQTLSPLRCGV